MLVCVNGVRVVELLERDADLPRIEAPNARYMCAKSQGARGAAPPSVVPGSSGHLQSPAALRMGMGMGVGVGAALFSASRPREPCWLHGQALAGGAWEGPLGRWACAAGDTHVGARQMRTCHVPWRLARALHGKQWASFSGPRGAPPAAHANQRARRRWGKADPSSNAAGHQARCCGRCSGRGCSFESLPPKAVHGGRWAMTGRPASSGGRERVVRNVTFVAGGGLLGAV